MSRPKFVFYILVLLALILIVFRFYFLESKTKGFKEEEISFEGVISREPDVRDTNIKLTISSADGIFAPVLATVPRYPEYKYGDSLRLTGKLQAPVEFEDFNYKNYLKAKKIYAVMYYPKVQLVDSGRGFFIYSEILEFKNKLKKAIYSSIRLPESSILSAMILGDQGNIPKSFKDKLNLAGIRHVVAISGMHIVIISNILASLFLGIGLSKKRSVLCSLFCLILYIIAIGFPASAVRAGIMGSLFLIAPLFGRSSFSLRSITLAGLAMLIINPFLIYDIGFQLSFAAALGIILLSSAFNRWFKIVPKKIREILASTLSAYILTLPILIYNFGQVSLSGPIANILILPIIPITMGLGFLFAVSCVFIPLLGWILSFPAFCLLWWIVFVANMFSKNWMIKTFVNIHWTWPVFLYIIIIPVVFYIYKKKPSYFPRL